MAGLGDYMVLPVHDEIVLDLPQEYAAEAEIEVPKIMAKMDYPVALTADADGPFERGARSISSVSCSNLKDVSVFTQ